MMRSSEARCWKWDRRLRANPEYLTAISEIQGQESEVGAAHELKPSPVFASDRLTPRTVDPFQLGFLVSDPGPGTVYNNGWGFGVNRLDWLAGQCRQCEGQVGIIREWAMGNPDNHS